MLDNYLHGAAPAVAAADAVRPGSSCDFAQGGEAPAVDTAYLSEQLPAAVPAVATPGDIVRAVMLTVTERVQSLASTLKPAR